LNLLFDTQSILWLSSGHENLGKHAARHYEQAQAVYFSSLSIFELAIKQAAGKLRVQENFASTLLDAGLRELSLRSTDAAALSRFGSLVKHDPFDRMLLAQAASHQLNFITSDRKLLALGLDWVIDARI
jgi:PIN domain nuclease of toxin-antitoxin system